LNSNLIVFLVRLAVDVLVSLTFDGQLATSVAINDAALQLFAPRSMPPLSPPPLASDAAALDDVLALLDDLPTSGIRCCF
jgi:hypothetical protein